MIISYQLGNSLYLNLTNRCSNACDFCLRSAKREGVVEPERWTTSDDLSGSNELWLEREPTVDEVIENLKTRNLAAFEQVVFCGFGEPFMRFDDCKQVAAWLKSQGVIVRVNTNGQANLLTGRDVTPEMVGLFDVVSISMNNKNAAEYQQQCHSDFGEKSFDALLDFGERCAKLGMETVFTVVDLLPPADIAACRQLAEERGCTLRVRALID